jgi:hypothetical protein
MVERGRGDDQVVGGILGGEVLSGGIDEPDTLVGGAAAGDLDHPRRRVDAEELRRVRQPSGELAEDVTGAGTHVQDTFRCRRQAEGELDDAIGDLLMQLPVPAFLVRGGTVVERLDVPVTRHAVSLPRFAALPVSIAGDCLRVGGEGRHGAGHRIEEFR